jgi:hypothetical protein
VDSPLSNAFDELGTGFDPTEAKKQKDEMEAKANKLDYLIHQTFSQNPAGAELLALWKDSLIMAPTASPGDEVLQIGIAEGHKSFIRGILLTVRKVEND